MKKEKEKEEKKEEIPCAKTNKEEILEFIHKEITDLGLNIFGDWNKSSWRIDKSKLENHEYDKKKNTL